MKRIFLYLLFSIVFLDGAFAQKQFLDDALSLSSSINLPQPLTTVTYTCNVGVDTLIFTISETDLICNNDNSGTATVTIIKGTPPYNYLWSNGQTTTVATGFSAGNKNVEVFDAAGNDCVGFININEPGALIISSVTLINASCASVCDGSATASISGGTLPYTYLWTPIGQATQSAINLCAGSYSISVTDNHGCLANKKVTITQPVLLLANGSSSNISCFGACNGSVSAAPTGGTPPYTYSWNTGATTSSIAGRCPGTYTCTVRDSKTCVDTYITTITEPPLLTVSVTGTNLVCNGVCTGSVTATASGGTGAYTYSWAPGGSTSAAVTGLCAGTYTLTLTDGNACSKTATITLTQPTAVTAAPTGTNINCFNQCDGTVRANAGGGTSPYTYNWSPGGCTTSACSNLCFGTYTVNVNDANSCAISRTVTLTQPALLTVAPSNTNVTCSGFCNGSVTATAAGGTSPYTYLWLPGGYTTSARAGLCAGDYSITVTDTKGCTATGSVTITSPLPLLSNLSSTGTSCFGVCDGSVSSAASGGTIPYTYNWSNGKTTSSCSGICAGTYTLTLRDSQGCIATNTISVSQPNIFTASISSASPNPLNCNGDCNGTAVVTPNGGTAPYSYLWSTGATATTPSVTGLCAGIYNVNLTDLNGCTASVSITFSQPNTLSVTVASSNPTCSGGCNGSISAIAGGGTPGYTFSWLPGGQTTSTIASLCVEDYTLTVTDSKGCTNIQTVTLSTAFPLIANASVVTNVSCSGSCDGSVTANPTGGSPPFSYLWTGGSTAQTVTGLCAGTFSVTVTDANGCTNIDIVTITQPSVLSSSIASTTSSCSLCTGTASVTTSGGTAPYTYLWTPSGQTTDAAVGLCIGTYSVNVTDANGCTNSIAAVIPPVVTLTVTVSGTSVNCAGSCDGLATATPFGGNNPYTYMWSPSGQTTQSVTGFCAGTYTVNVADANGCISANTLSFSDPPALSVAMDSTDASCGICNGTATATPSGGTGSYTYTWSGFPVQTTATATGLCSGNYTVTVEDSNNCTITNTITVGNIPSISDNPSITLANCGLSDGSICVAPTGGTTPYTYAWAPGGATTACITGLPSGIYTVTITDAVACAGTFPIGVGNATGPTVNVTSSSNPSCNGYCNGSITVSASAATPPYTFLWTPGGETTNSITGLCSDTYIVQVQDAVPCTTFATVILTDPAPIVSNPSATNVSCNGGNNGSICLAPSGGTGPYTFSWSNGQTTACATGLIAGTYTVAFSDASGCSDTISIPISEPSLLSVTLASSNVTCNGMGNGTATATVTGGTTAYAYAWSTGSPLSSIVGLVPGNYSITVTDNKGCTATATVAITQPTALTTTISSTNVSCNSLCDGTATLTTAGGNLPYSYFWLPGGETTLSITGLCVGNYDGTITDALGCSSSKSVAITQPPVLSVSVIAVDASCFGGCNGTASANASGGTGIYTYDWNPGGATTSSVTGLCAGSYTLSLADANGCVVNDLFSISSPTQIQANITNTSPSCFGGCNGTATSAPVGGSAPYTYLWNNGQTNATATGLCAGTYTLTLFDANGCSIAQTTNVSDPVPITVSTGVADATCLICNGSITVISSGGTGPYSYSWNSGQTSANITGLCAGVYVVTVTDAIGCTAVDSIAVSNTSGPSLVTNGTNSSCFGFCNGTSTVTATGDGPPWNYSWSTGPVQTTATATGLCAAPYFVTVTDTNGCVTVGNITITQPGTLASNPTITNTTCFGVCNGGITLNPSGGTAPYTYNWMPGGQTSISISSQCAGNYTATITDAKGCALSTTMTIGQNTILTSTVTSTNDSCNALCDGTAAVNISGGTFPYTYSWSTGPVQTTSAVTGLCVGTFTITVTDAIGCMRIDSAVIGQTAMFAPNISVISPLCNSVCNGSASAVPTGGTAPYTFSWNPGGETTSSVTGLCVASYTLAASDANGCKVNTTFPVSPSALIQANITNTSPLCFGGCNGTATSAPVGGSAPYTYLWNNGQTNATATGLCAGTYTLTLFDANGCSISQTTNVADPAPITISTGVADATCLICNGTITVIASAGTIPYSYAWNSGQTTANISGLCAALYVVTVTDVIGCTAVDSIAVSNTSGPSLVTNGTNSSCFGFCNGTSTVTATGDGPPWNYSWSTGPVQTTATATGLCAAPYFITVTDTNGCVTVGNIAITQPATLASNPTITNTTCLGVCNGGITLNPSGGTAPYTFNWMPGGQTTISISSQCAGNYTANITDAKGCALSTTMTIGQNTILTSTVTSTNDSCNAVCDGTAAVTISSGTFPYTYSWSGGQTSTAVTGLCVGTFTITVTDAIGCMRIDSAVITQPAVLASNTSGVNPLCNGDCNGSVSAVPTGGTLPYTYLWNSGGATTASVTGLCAGNFTLMLTDANKCSVTNTVVLTSPALIASTDIETKSNCSNTHDGSIVITPSGGTLPYTYNWQPGNLTTQNATGIVAGIYSVTITDANGCSLTDSMTVGANILVIAVAGNDTSFCVGGMATLCNGSINATSFGWYHIQNPTWTQIDTTTCMNATPFISTDYALIVSNAACSDTDTVAVTVFPAPSVNAGSDATILSDGTGAASLNGSGSGIFSWTPATGLSCTTCANPSANPTVTTTYTLEVIDTITGCSSWDSVKVTVVPIIVPNDGISPNGDGKNDFWVIPFIELFPECVVEVYNRWGELIFSERGYTNSTAWDGKFKGKDLPVGTYYYTINLNSTKFPDPITGPITIMR